MIASRHQNLKSIKKLVEEAESSGELHLKNRKLKDISICFSDYNLLDVTIADLSHNSLNEIPRDMWEWHCLLMVNLSYNSIKTIPSLVTDLCLIEVLDLSNNLISHLPSCISELKTLVVLLLQNNKIVSMPGSIGRLKKCQKLDVSGNTLNSLPSEIGDMTSLMHLDVSRNGLYSIPDEIGKLDLIYLDASANKISTIPLCFQDMKELENVNFNYNPLTSPPLSIIRKGRIHMFKLMQSESAKAKRQQEVMEPLLVRKRDKVSQKGTDSGLEDIVQNITQQSFFDRSEVLQTTTVNHSSLVKSPVEANKENVYEEVPAPTPSVPPSENHEATNNHNSIEKCSKETEIDGNKTADSAANVSPSLTKQKSQKSLSSAKPKVLQNKKKIPVPKTNSKLTGFPGYTPPPIKEKPKKRPSHLHGKNADQTQYLEVIKPRTALTKKVRAESENDLSFTMRRKTEKIYEELELLEDLRRHIESALKMPLPPDLLPSLTDGVVLCHLANHVKSRSIPTIHVPSPAVPKLSLAKSRRNVDNFVDACVKLGVPQSKLCSAADVMHGKGVARIVNTVTSLLKLANQNGTKKDQSFSTPSVRIAPSHH